MGSAFKKLIWLLVMTSVGLGAFFVFYNYDELSDWWKLRNYEPSTVVKALATDSGMSDTGRKFFYVNDPMLLGRSEFGGRCSVGEETIVLGCYVSGEGIYLFNVEDDRLAGVEEVTAAHEMLHAVYERLSTSEKEVLNALLADAFKSINNSRIKETIDTYERRDPHTVENELHSILGTEVRSLPEELEKHYAQYFEKRTKVVDMAESYADEFEQREEQIEKYDAQLASLESDISILETDLRFRLDALSDERTLINSNGGSPEAHNEAVRSYNAKVRAYNDDVARIKGMVERHNTLVAKRNAIASEERELVEAIDTRIDQL